MYKFEFNPIVEEIFIHKGVLATAIESYGHVVLFDMKGNFILDEEKPWNSRKRIGRIIKPRWDKYYQKWQLLESRVRKEGKDGGSY